MKRVLILALVAITASVLVGCSFSEYSQTVDLLENIDDYRTGCEIDTDKLMAGYKQYEANEYYYDTSFGQGTPSPTSTPSPISDAELTSRIMLETTWENGCLAGRRDVVGAEQATLLGLQDALALLAEKIAALEPTPVPTLEPTVESSSVPVTSP